LARLVGLTKGTLSPKEKHAYIDDAIYTEETATTPVRNQRPRSHSPKSERRIPTQRARAKTPELSRQEKQAQNTIKGVNHAKARLIIDKRNAAENKPATIIRPTRSNFKAPDIWPLPPGKKNISKTLPSTSSSSTTTSKTAKKPLWK